MSFFTERSIYWRPDALIPAPIFCRIHWIWAPLKVGVSRNKCSDKRGIMYFEMLALRRGKISTCNMPFNCTSNVGSGLYGLNPCTNKIISCTYNVIYAN
jgi:hypothetical protein